MEKSNAGKGGRASCSGSRTVYLKREAWKFSLRCYLSKDMKEVTGSVSGSDQRDEAIWLSFYQGHLGQPLRIDKGDTSH